MIVVSCLQFAFFVESSLELKGDRITLHPFRRRIHFFLNELTVLNLFQFFKLEVLEFEVFFLVQIVDVSSDFDVFDPEFLEFNLTLG